MNVRQVIQEPQIAQQPDRPQLPPQDGIDLAQLFRMVIRRRWVILGTGWLVASLVFAFTMLQPPEFTATARVMISPQKEQVVASSQKVLSDAPTDSGLVDSQIEIIQSRKLLGQLSDRLKLADNPDWNPSLKPPGLVSSILAPIRGATEKPTKEAVRESIVNQLAKSISAKRKRLTYVIDIAAVADDPVLAARMANTMVDLYLESQLQTRLDAGKKANAWLSQSLEGLKEEVRAKEAAVEAYRAETGLLTSEGSSLTEQQMSELQASVIGARTELAEREARYRQVQTILQAGGSLDSIAGAISSETIRDLRAQEAEVARRQADLEARYSEAHPAVQKVRVERAGIETQIRAEVSRISTNLKNEADVARARLATLQGNQNSIKGELVTNNAGMVKLRELERDAAATRAVYEGQLQRFREISGAGGADAPDARIVSEAAKPNQPSGPLLGKSLVTALLLGLIVGFGSGFAVDKIDDVVDGAGDVKRITGETALAAIPRVGEAALEALAPAERHPAGYLVDMPMSAFAESFRALRSRIMMSGQSTVGGVVAVTSAIPGDGKTTTSLCLARACAMAGHRVIVIDCDLRRRSLNAVLGVTPTSGILQVLKGEAHWRSVLHDDPATGAQLLPAAPGSFTAKDVFGSKDMERLIGELRQEYDWIILDCPPVLAVVETRTLARLADKTVIIVRPEKTPRSALKETVENLGFAGANVIGAAMNFRDHAAELNARYGYGYNSTRSKYTAGYYSS
jgi:succinoglycan biosynthesis transport protein ExoP